MTEMVLGMTACAGSFDQQFRQPLISVLPAITAVRAALDHVRSASFGRRSGQPDGRLDQPCGCLEPTAKLVKLPVACGLHERITLRRLSSAMKLMSGRAARALSQNRDRALPAHRR
jgi:hypothetical protein